VAQDQNTLIGKELHQNQPINKGMKDKKKKVYKKPEPKTCPYCGSEKIERIQVHHVGVIKTCKNCREQIE
jgi:ribosomal protein L37AE/L43A